MKTRHFALLAIVAASLLAFIVSGILSPNWSASDVLFTAGFAVIFLFAVFVSLILRGNKPVRGQYGLPRWVWVLFASCAVAFAIGMLSAVVMLPWFGYKGFHYFLGGGDGSWFFLVLTLIAYPFVNRKLL